MTEDFFGPPIHIHTRAQMIDDGDLIDVTEQARETGFRFPMALTRAVWETCVAWTKEDAKRKGEMTAQDERGRLHDVLWMAYLAARRGAGTSRLRFSVIVVSREGRGTRHKVIDLELVIGPGDTPEPVITVQFPGED